METKMHIMDKPYRCGTCEKAFAMNDDLVQHMLIHTENEQFVCGTCFCFVLF